MLLQLGCDQAQGYGIAHPMPGADMPSWSAAWRIDPVWESLHAVKRADLPLLYASVEHRAWIVSMGNYLKGERQMPPPLNIHQCRFGQWLDAEGRARFTTKPAFLAIEPLHQQVHALAQELCDLHGQEQSLQALARLTELHALRDALLAQLQLLVQESLR
jgi:uncharacterized protein YjiS (DUF1127 family)